MRGNPAPDRLSKRRVSMLHEVFQYNLNLLPSLAMLIETGSVSEAARRMHVTQSTMSRNLALLRDSLNDPILVRSGNATTATPMARRILPRLLLLLGEAGSIFENPFFEPATCMRHFRVSASYTYTSNVLTDILKKVHAEAPLMTLATLINTNSTIDRLTAGDIDIYVGFFEDVSDLLDFGEMFVDQMYIVTRKDHPLASVPMDKAADLEKLLEYRYIQLSGSALPSNKSMKMDRYFSRKSFPWLTTTIPDTVFESLLHSDAFSFVTGTEFWLSKKLDALSCRPCPEPILFSNKIIWPAFASSSRSHRWLREIMLEMTSQVLDKKDFPKNVDSAVVRSLEACGRMPRVLPSTLFYIRERRLAELV